MSLIERLDDARSRWNVLRHPFYVRWERGELTPAELAEYAGEYRHAVAALAETAERAAELGGREHAAEERAHVSLWDDFATAVEAEDANEPHAETTSCVAAWTAAPDPLAALAILYAIEAGQPDVSGTKLEGLVEHYGFEPDARGAGYFVVHAERDHAHAAEARALLERHARPQDDDRLVATAELALAGNWALLDGVSR
jgi:pyrroloquinoline quinone (PQQ) biosynthesis protein C